VFIRMESLSVKGQEPIFVYVICKTLIKIKHCYVQNGPQRDSDGGLIFHKVGKGKGDESLEREAKC
jgi:hypothetical protein